MLKIRLKTNCIIFYHSKSGFIIPKVGLSFLSFTPPNKTLFDKPTNLQSLSPNPYYHFLHSGNRGRKKLATAGDDDKTCESRLFFIESVGCCDTVILQEAAH